MVIDDVIVFFPPQLGEALRSFARDHAIDWLLALAWGRELDRTVERIVPRLERLDEIAGQGAKAVQSLDARLDTIHEQVEAVQGQMTDFTAEFRTVQASVHETAPAEPGADFELLEALRRILERLRAIRGQLTVLSESQREARQLIEAQTEAVAEARRRADALLRAGGGPGGRDRAAARAEVGD
jgi:prefoldin subunit 5